MHTILSGIIDHAETIGLILGAICTLGIFSLLYKENPYYRLLEHIFIGLATGYGFFINWSDVLQPKWWDPMVNKGQWWWALPVTAGTMYYFIFSKKHSWISRFIFGFMFGLGAGMTFQAFANTMIPQIEASFKPLVPPAGVPIREAASTMLGNFVFFAVLVTVMGYFFFSIDHRARAVRGTASLGRWFLMFAFGAMFGATVMARMALFIGRMDFLVTDVPRPFWWIAGPVFAALIVLYLILRTPPPKKRDEAFESTAEAEPLTEDR